MADNEQPTDLVDTVYRELLTNAIQAVPRSHYLYDRSDAHCKILGQLSRNEEVFYSPIVLETQISKLSAQVMQPMNLVSMKMPDHGFG